MSCGATGSHSTSSLSVNNENRTEQLLQPCLLISRLLHREHHQLTAITITPTHDDHRQPYTSHERS
jgi:hypothetical protein